jgi:hypothetical protein
MDNNGLIYDKSRNSSVPKAEFGFVNLIIRELHILNMNASAFP